MKKLVNKIIRRGTPRPETGGRITNETVAEHRERVLAGGRKFKYPLQYTKRRILWMSIVIAFLTTLLFAGFLAWQLYTVQSNDRFIYRLTQVLPLPVAKVEQDWVRYSDYLLDLRSSIHYLTTKEAINLNSDDGKRQLEDQKRLALNKAIGNTFVARLARENNVTVGAGEVDDFVRKQIASNRLGVNEELYKQVIADYYDWTFDEYKNSVRQQLLRKKVSAKLDEEGRKRAEDLHAQLLQGKDFAALAKEQSDDALTKGQGGDAGFVARSAEDPSGLVATAAGLQVNQVSGVIEGAEGFYIIKVLETRDQTEVRFAKILVNYTVLNKKIAELKQKGAIKELIKVQEVAAPTSQ